MTLNAIRLTIDEFTIVPDQLIVDVEMDLRYTLIPGGLPENVRALSANMTGYSLMVGDYDPTLDCSPSGKAVLEEMIVRVFNNYIDDPHSFLYDRLMEVVPLEGVK